MLARSTSSSTNTDDNVFDPTSFNNVSHGSNGAIVGGVSGGDYIRPPISYTCHSLDDFRLQQVVCSEVPNQHHECVLDSLTSNHFSSGGESNLKRRQSSEDFLEMHAARNYQMIQEAQYCHHFCTQNDFSASEAEDGVEAMVDEDDPLEIARQGTVHIWENVEAVEQNAVICHGLSDDFLRTVSPSSGPLLESLGTSDDPVLYQ